MNHKRHRKLSRAFSDLVYLLRSAPFEDFNVSFNERKTKRKTTNNIVHFHRFSFLEQIDQVCTFSENAALRLATNEVEDFINYNKRFLSRITPGTWRVDSSNLNPQDFWNVGCQMGSFTDVFFDLIIQTYFSCSSSGHELSNSRQIYGCLFWTFFYQWWLWLCSQTELFML